MSYYEKNHRIYLTDPTDGGATPGRARSMTWLEDPPPWLRPGSLTLYLLYFDSETISVALAAFVF